MNFDTDLFLQRVTTLPGVYQMLDDKKKIIYVGKAKNLKNRLSSYFKTKNLMGKTKAMVAQIADVQTTITHTETEALILENNLIKKHQPRYNILLRDDRSYPYIFLSSHAYPRLSFHRGAQKAKGQYFGPYPNSQSVRESLRLLQKIFPVRQCEDSVFAHRERPCLQAQIGRCTAPCVGAISVDEYDDDVQNAVLFLKGKSNQAASGLEHKMNMASEQMAYEQAAKYRDQITHLRHIQEQQFVSNLHGSFDVLAIAHEQQYACVQLFVYRHGHNLGNQIYFFKHIHNHSSHEILNAFIGQHYLSGEIPSRLICNIQPSETTKLQKALSQLGQKKIYIQTAIRGEKTQLIKNAVANAKISLNNHIKINASVKKQLSDLQVICKLDDLPKRMECFDISHTFGELPVASCVVFTNGIPDTSAYRRFNIKSVTGGDDYAAMLQAITRRYTRLIKTDAILPDLLIVDGGKGQLLQAEKVLDDLQIHIHLLGVAKGPKRQAGKERLFLSSNGMPLALPRGNQALYLIQKIRDEAHRFAITGHRTQRKKKRIQSNLQDISGIGNKRRQALLQHFGGLQEIKKAGVLDLRKVKGISSTKAEAIYDYFHP